MISSMLCSYDDSLLSVMKNLNDSAMGISFVLDEDKKLCGTVTDGDIRRALLKDSQLDENVGSIIIKEYTYATVSDDYEVLFSKITDQVKVIPIVDADFQVVDYFEYKQNVYFPVAIPNINGNELKYLTDAFLSSWISSQGEYIDKFEDQFANYSDTTYGVTVSNGTAALHLALLALNIGEGDEVIIPDLTFAATINVVLHAQAIPVIVDVEEDSWCISAVEIEKNITKKTRAIIPVHLYGQPCDMNAIMKIAKKYNLKVIEDCAEAHGAMQDGKKVGSFGDIGCFSFFGNKIITTGEGGMCTTNNSALDEKIRILRDHGMSKTKRYWHEVVGYNYRMTNLQAAIGLAQLERIVTILSNRREYEVGYKSILGNNISFQCDFKDRKRITWLVSLLLDDVVNRDQYIDKLQAKGIEARPFFYPLSDMNIYKMYCNEFTTYAHIISKKGVTLPTYESLKSLEELKMLIKEVELQKVN
jgi:perosamine synthetase